MAEERVFGAQVYREVPWDSELLGAPCFELRAFEPASLAADEAAFAAACAPRLVHARVPARDLARVHALEAAGYHFMELHLRARRRLRPEPGWRPRFRIEEAAAGDELEDVAAICEGSFRTDRFTLDPGLGPALAGARYAGWVRRALGEPGVVVARYRVGGELAGFLLVEVREARADFLLGAIAAPLQGRGLFHYLVEDLRGWAAARGARTLEAGIAAKNVEVLNIYARQGFAFDPPLATLHKLYGRGGQGDLSGGGCYIRGR